MEYFQSNAASAILLLFHNNLHFQDQTFGILFDLQISWKWCHIEEMLLLL